VLSLDQATANLVAQGYTPQEAIDALGSQNVHAVDKHWQTLIDHCIDGIVAGYMTVEQFAGVPTLVTSGVAGAPGTSATQFGGLLGLLPLSDAEKVTIYRVVATLASLPRSRLTPAELSTALEDGFLDPGLYTQQLRLHGYDELEQQVLIEEALLKLTTGKTVAKVKELTLAEAKAALKAGVLTDAGFRQYLSDVGYSAEAISVLMALYASPPPPPAPPPASPVPGS